MREYPPEYYRSQPRSLTTLLPLLLVLVSALLVVQVWNLWKRDGFPVRTLQSDAQARPIAPAGDLAEDEKATIALFK
ncbi:MAG: hypothetical protein JF612_11645, partial [Planctomycetia bacterium]|nr:hypothetical protein [Planctomycetia bacterium]